MKSIKSPARRDMLRGRAGQSYFRVHGGAIGVGRKGDSQKTLFPPIEIVEAREGGAEGVGKVGRVIQCDKYMGGR